MWYTPVPGIPTVRRIFPSAPMPTRKPGTPTDAPTPDLLMFILANFPIRMDFRNLSATSPPPCALLIITSRFFFGALAIPPAAVGVQAPSRNLRPPAASYYLTECSWSVVRAHLVAGVSGRNACVDGVIV